MSFSSRLTSVKMLVLMPLKCLFQKSQFFLQSHCIKKVIQSSYLKVALARVKVNLMIVFVSMVSVTFLLFNTPHVKWFHLCFQIYLNVTVAMK